MGDRRCGFRSPYKSSGTYSFARHRSGQTRSPTIPIAKVRNLTRAAFKIQDLEIAAAFD